MSSSSNQFIFKCNEECNEECNQCRNHEYPRVIVSLTSIKIRYTSGILQKTLTRLVNLNYANYIVVLNVSTNPKYLDDGFTEEDIKCLKIMYPKIMVNVVENYGSLRKLIPSLQMFKSTIIISVDDDVIYNKNLITEYVKVFSLHNCIIAARCRNISLCKHAQILSFGMTEYNKCKLNVLPEGVGGILYNSNMFDDKFVNFDFNNLEEEFLKNDDLLIRAYTYVKNILVFHKNISYTDMMPYGLYGDFNHKYIINFKKFIDKIKFILAQ